MKDQFPWGASHSSQDKHDGQQLSQLNDPASMVDADTVALTAMNSIPPAEVPHLSQFHQHAQKSIQPVNPIADVDTVSLAAMSNTPPAQAGDISQYYQYTQKPNQSTTPIVEQETLPLRSVQVSAPTVSHSAQDDLPGVVQRAMNMVRTRLQDPQPEGLLTSGLRAVKPEARLGALSVLTLTTSFGLLIVSFAYYLSVEMYPYLLLETVFFAGLLLMLVPNLVRLLSRAPSRSERIGLLCILGIGYYFVQFMTSPFHFSGYDESLHWRTANDILSVGHLFSKNTMLPVSPYYPGLEIITNAISTTTGLNTFYAGNIVIIAARILIIFAIFLFSEKITNSSRMAGVAVILYMMHQHFIIFDAYYSYETLALPLAMFMLYILVRYEDEGKDRRWVISFAWIVLLALNVTHHMTSYIFDGFLLLWAGVSFFRPVSRSVRIHLAAIAIFGLCVSLAYMFLQPGNPVWGYLSDYFGISLHQLAQIIDGTSKARALFGSGSSALPIWDRLLVTGSIAIIMFGLPFGLLFLQQQHRSNALAVTMGTISLLYPVLQIFRFTTFGIQITDRSAAFLFLPISYVLTILITHFWPTRGLSKRTIAMLTSALIVVFLGGIIVESGPNLGIIPGPYLVVADARSVEPEGINAAIWSLTYLGPNNRVATDRVNQMLMNTYGDQNPVTYINDKIDISPIFYSEQFNNSDIATLHASQIHYLVVDLRLSTGLPLEGTYFVSDQATQIISRDALMKFNTVTQMNRLFDSGDIAIYDTDAFLQ